MKDLEIKEKYQIHLTNSILKYLAVKLVLAIIILLYFIYSDLRIRHNTYEFYTRLLPLILAVVLLISHLTSKKYQYAKVLLYNIFLASLLLMMLANCIVHLNENSLASVVSGTILVIFMISLDIKTSVVNTIIIYLAPIVVFILVLVVFFNLQKEQKLILSNIYPIIIIGYTTNRIQNKLSFKNFKSNFLLNVEKEKTIAFNEELNQKNEKLEAQKHKITTQKTEIEKAHKNMLSSISYAQLIQNAMLPTNELFNTHFSEYFILFKPRDIISGDFYWAKKVNNILIFAAADSTGHGVPGALLSMLGMSLLDEIVRNYQITTAGQVLDNLRYAIKTSLNQNDANDVNKDGMDIALCVINLETNELQYAGAYNPLYIIRNTEFIELKADRQPIAVHIEEKQFTNHTLNLQQNDILYLFSDGYSDQFNELTNKKFTTRRFKKVLTDIANNSLSKQKQILEQNLNQWLGNTKQIDDILVMGVKIN